MHKSREIRRVPVGWEHPKIDDPNFPSPYWRDPEEILHDLTTSEGYVKSTPELDLDRLEQRRAHYRKCRDALGLGDGEAFIPMHDQSFDEACEEWDDYLVQWALGTYPDQPKDMPWTLLGFEEWHGPRPSLRHVLSSFRPEFDSEPVFYQVYETITEGTPVSPVFPGFNELYRWLITDAGLDTPWGEEDALAFISPLVTATA